MEIVARACHLSSLQVLIYLFSSVPAYGITQLGLRFIPLGHLYLRPLQRHFYSLGLTDRFTPPRRSAHWSLPTFYGTGRTYVFLLRNPYPHVSGGLHDFCRRLHAGVGRSHGGFPDFGYLEPYRPQAPYQLSGAQGSSLCPKALGSNAMLCLTVELLLWLEAQNIIVRARHIPGCLNVIVDHLSRQNQPISTEWSLHPEIVKRIFRLWGTPEVDMFATVSNSHLPRFMSPVPEPQALAVDALSQDWQWRSMYMFPPFSLLNKVIQKLRSTQAAEVILVAPWWPKQS